MGDYSNDDDLTDDEKEAAIKAYAQGGQDQASSDDDDETEDEPSQSSVDETDNEASDDSKDEKQDAPPAGIQKTAALPAIPQIDPAARKEELIRQYAAANDTSGIKAAQAQSARTNYIANIGDALESLAKSNSMAHGGAGVDTGFYNAIKQQGQQGVDQAQQARQVAIQQFNQDNAVNHQVMQDMLLNGNVQQQQTMQKMQAAMADPNSQISKNKQQAFAAAYGNLPEFSSLDVNKMSANDIDSAGKTFEKKASLDYAKSNKEMQLAYQQNNLKDKKDIKQDQLYTEANAKATTARGNPAVQQAQTGVASGQKALDILKQYPDANQMPPQMVNLFTTEVAKVAAGGVPGEHGTAAIQANTFESAWNNFLQKVGGQPTGAQLAPFIAQYKNYLENMTKTNQNTIGTYEGQVYNGYKKRFTPEQDMQWKMDHPAAFQNQDTDTSASNANSGGKQQQASNTPVPAPTHPQVDQAQIWAKANPNDPRASEILKRIGGGMNAGL